jgi:glucuronate isomerase
VSRPLTLHPDRLFASDPVQRDIARALYATIADAPIVSPHGHTDPRWFADNQPWSDATTLLLQPDHYIFRMLYSQGVPLDALAIRRRDGEPATDRREAWRTFAERYHLFRGTPSRLWLDHVFAEVFGFEEVLDGGTADRYFDRIGDALASDTYRPRALFDRFGIDFLATTEGAHDDLDAHHRIHASGWKGRVVTTYRPDSVIDVEHEQFAGAMQRFAELTGEDVYQLAGYLAAHRRRRADFRAAGATATDHGHPTAATAESHAGGGGSAVRADRRRHLDDGRRRTVPRADADRNGTHVAGRWHGDADPPWQLSATTMPACSPATVATRAPTFRRAPNYVQALKPMLDVVGNAPDLTIILFTLDESVYARELAPLAGHYPVPAARPRLVVP